MDALLQTDALCYETNHQTILSDITLSIEKGSNLTITGPSGGGKSTLLKLLATLISPTSGNISFHNQPITAFTPEDYRKRVSYCFQQPTLFGNTVSDNLTFPYTVRNEAFDESHAVQLLEQVHLTKDYLTKKITELSGGEKQRIALLRNVLFLPEVLLLDEVTTGLDEESKTIVNQWLVHLNKEQGLTLLRVTHDSGEIQQANELIYIANGQMEVNK
ncbi:hypothetical protein IGI37_001334 [Enterococcus sp. AZ194]|uniref:ABC transporter ATP-binding protein n=1 Tax=Enterococcus sp. AZ194 TaxID=2774629 RepID=UPI003F226561